MAAMNEKLLSFYRSDRCEPVKESGSLSLWRAEINDHGGQVGNELLMILAVMKRHALGMPGW